MTALPVISLWQPWASLMFTDRGDGQKVKTIETRSWAPPAGLVGQRMGIASAAKPPTGGGDPLRSTPVGDWLPFRQHDGDRGWVMEHYAVGHPGAPDRVALPLGAMLGTGILADAVPMVTPEQSIDWMLAWNQHGTQAPKHLTDMHYQDGPDQLVLVEFGSDGVIVEDQRPFGWFEPGRWAWIYDDLLPTTEQCPECWGEKGRMIDPLEVLSDWTWREPFLDPCDTCNGVGVCDPIPVKGLQRVWWWKA